MPYVTAGYPRLDDTVPLLLALQRAGCVAAEVGVPFSDPLADGPTIQRTGWHALQQGMTLALSLRQVREAREAGAVIPLALMTYVNPILSYGVDAFALDAAASGVDGVIVPDLPFDEAATVRDTVHRAGVVLIPLVAPTTTRERIERGLADAGGFVYCVGVRGVTGARDTVAPEALELLDLVRTVSALPRALGFGIARPAHLDAVRGRAEAVVVGSALLDAIGRDEEHPVDAAEHFLQTLT